MLGQNVFGRVAQSISASFLYVRPVDLFDKNVLKDYVNDDQTHNQITTGLPTIQEKIIIASLKILLLFKFVYLFAVYLLAYIPTIIKRILCRMS